MCAFYTCAEILAELFIFFMYDILEVKWGKKDLKNINPDIILKNKVVNWCNYACY